MRHVKLGAILGDACGVSGSGLKSRGLGVSRSPQLNVFRSIIFPHYYKTATSPFSAVGATSSLLTPQRRLPEEFVCQDERDGTVLGVPLQRAQP